MLYQKGVFMVSYKITKLKDFMSKLLTTDCFDAFLLEQAVITTYNTFTIDGRIEKAFYSAKEWEAAACPYRFSCWSELRPICFSLIKGKKAPVGMKFILQLKPEKQKALLAKSETVIPEHYISAFVVTIRYGAAGMSCTTGISYSDFLADKTPERIWDQAFARFLAQADIACEII